MIMLVHGRCRVQFCGGFHPDDDDPDLAKDDDRKLDAKFENNKLGMSPSWKKGINQIAD